MYFFGIKVSLASGLRCIALKWVARSSHFSIVVVALPPRWFTKGNVCPEHLWLLISFKMLFFWRYSNQSLVGTAINQKESILNTDMQELENVGHASKVHQKGRKGVLKPTTRARQTDCENDNGASLCTGLCVSICGALHKTRHRCNWMSCAWFLTLSISYIPVIRRLLEVDPTNYETYMSSNCSNRLICWL